MGHWSAHELDPRDCYVIARGKFSRINLPEILYKSLILLVPVSGVEPKTP